MPSSPKPSWAKASGSRRGKYAEGKVYEALHARAVGVASFTFNRIQDAGAAQGGMSVAQPGDFQWFWAICDIEMHGVVRKFTRNGLIEVKEVQHGYRLPHKNFKPDQVGRLRVREMAGSEVLVLVCFRDEAKTLGWRSAPLSYFTERTGGSWDMTEFPLHPNVSNLLEGYFV